MGGWGNEGVGVWEKNKEKKRNREMSDEEEEKKRNGEVETGLAN